MEKKEVAKESISEELIPDEFSDEDDIGYEDAEEKFQPRESISSRGMGGREPTQRFSRVNRPTNIHKHTGDIFDGEEFDNYNEDSFDPVDGRESSVVTEIVENKVVYLDDDELKNDDLQGSQRYDHMVTLYLSVGFSHILCINAY